MLAIKNTPTKTSSNNFNTAKFDYKKVYPTNTAVEMPTINALEQTAEVLHIKNRINERNSNLSQTRNGMSKSDTPVLTPRRVRFNNNSKRLDKSDINSDLNIQIIYIDNVTTSNRRLKAKLWYTAQDVANMMQQNASTIMLMNMGYTDSTLINTAENDRLRRNYHRNEQSDMTTRGLERYTKKGLARFLQTHESSVVAVLRQQEEDRDSPPFVRAERIAISYMKYVNETKSSSIRRAMTDAKYVVEHCRIQECTMDKIRQLQKLETSKRSGTSISLFNFISPRQQYIATLGHQNLSRL